MKRRVLLVDIDPQGNATMGSGIDKHEMKNSTCEVLMGEATAAKTIVKAGHGAGYDVMPGNDDLTAASVELINMQGRESRLKKALESTRPNYDYIFIDCPPSLSTLTVNALTAADSVLIPMQCEYYALEGLSGLVRTVKQIRDAVNPRLRIAGILRTMFDPRNNLASDVSEQLILHFGDKVYATIVPRNVRLAEAPSYGVPVLLHDKASRGALAYLALAGELTRREEESTRATA